MSHTKERIIVTLMRICLLLILLFAYIQFPPSANAIELNTAYYAEDLEIAAYPRSWCRMFPWLCD